MRRLHPPWFQAKLGAKLTNQIRRKKQGKAPLPASKAAQRAVAASLADRPATKIATGVRGALSKT